MTTAENKKLIQDLFTDFSTGDVDAAFGKLADDVRYTVIGTTQFSGTFRGKEEFMNKVLGPLGSQLEGGFTITVDRTIAEGDYVVVQTHGEATTKIGKPYNNTYAHVFHISNGRVTEWTEYLDTELVTTAFGK